MMEPSEQGISPMEIAQRVLSEHKKATEGLFGQNGPAMSRMYLAGMRYHILILRDTIALSSPKLYLNSVEWVRVLLASLNFRPEDTEKAFELLARELERALPPAEGRMAVEFIEAGIEVLRKAPVEVPTHLSEVGPDGKLAMDYLSALLRGDRAHAMQLINDRAKSMEDIKALYLNVFQRTQYEVGRLWQMGKLTVAQEHYCTSASQTNLSQLYPLILASRKHRSNAPAALVSCTEGELHEFGARMIADFLEMDGWDVTYLGANTPTDNIVRTAVESRPDLVFLSATSMKSAREMAILVGQMRASEGLSGVKIMVGGYPFNIDQELWRRVGADGFASDAQGALVRANELLGGVGHDR